MIELEKGIVWGSDVVMMQEPVFETQGYNISHPGYELIRGGRTMTALEEIHIWSFRMWIRGENKMYRCFM